VDIEGMMISEDQNLKRLNMHSLEKLHFSHLISPRAIIYSTWLEMFPISMNDLWTIPVSSLVIITE
jgi:hypothetical protein